VAKHEALEHFMDELRVEQRHYTRENRTLTRNRKSLVPAGTHTSRNIPLSDWIEHESRWTRAPTSARPRCSDMTVFDKGVVSSPMARRQEAVGLK